MTFGTKAIYISALLASVVLTAASEEVPKTAPSDLIEEPRLAPERPQPLEELSVSPRNANYTIEVKLDPWTHSLDGAQIVSWRNIQQQPTDELWFHLHWNAWRNNRSTWMAEDRLRKRGDHTGKEIEDDFWSYSQIDAIRLLPSTEHLEVKLIDAARFVATDDGNPDDRTVMAVRLPRAVGPGETIQLELVWHAQIPRTFARTGYRGEFYFLAHWFPQVAVFEPEGWNAHQFHAATEFYSDYGVYDVSMTVPADYVVGATGKEVERTNNPDGSTTHRYLQEDVHTFAWTASPDYLEQTTTFNEAGLPPVELRLLYQPEHSDLAERYLEATRTALKHFGTWYGPYPYDHLTIIDPAYGSGAGGMEYPTLFTGGARVFAPSGAGSPEGVTIHEAGHQFWYALVGNNEFEYAWLDEGLNTFSTARVYDEAYGERAYTHRFFIPPGTDFKRGFLPVKLKDFPLSRDVFGNRMHRFRPEIITDSPSSPTYLYFPETAGRISYDKTALWLATLERYLGWETLRDILSSFSRRYRFRHPQPEDLFAIFNEVSGQDLTWFFDQVHEDSVTFDYSVASATSQPAAAEGWVEVGGQLNYQKPQDPENVREYRTEVVIRRMGGGIFPVDVLMVFENGEEVRSGWDGKESWKVLVEERPSKLRYAVVDPDEILLLDPNRTNNSRLLEPVATLPALKWASRWMIWLQDFLTTYGFFS